MVELKRESESFVRGGQLDATKAEVMAASTAAAEVEARLQAALRDQSVATAEQLRKAEGSLQANLAAEVSAA
jgi:hypothetical protein